MMAPLPPPDPRPATGGPDGVRLDVRAGGSRAVGYPFDADEFLVGGAAGCDLRLPGAGVPPVVCQFSKSADGVRVRKLAPAVPVFLNGKPLAGSTPVPIRHGDRVAVGPAEITVHVPAGAYLSPRLVPIDDEPESAAAVDEREELVRLRAELEERERELEEDRAIWYRRRQEMEAELQRPQPPAAETATDLAAQQEELARLRQQLFDEYSAKRNDLVQAQEAVRAAEAAVADRRKELEDEYADRVRRFEEEIALRRVRFEEEVREYEPRLVELRLRREQVEAARHEQDEQRQAVEKLRADLLADRQSFDADIGWQREQLKEQEAAVAAREADFARREEQIRADRAAIDADRERYKDDLARLDRWQATLAADQQRLDARTAEVGHRFELLKRDTGELEDHAGRADAEHHRLRTEAERLDRLRLALDAEAGRLADRTARLEAQQAMAAVLRSALDRRQEEARQEEERLTAERVKQADARRELDQRLREAEHLRAELGTLRDDHDAQQRAFEERNSLLAATLDDFKRQKDELAAAEERLRQKEQELDARAAETAEQAAALRARVAQVLELQERLEADRLAVRDREGTLTESDAARQGFQEQLRKRAEELTARARQIDEVGQKLAEDRAVFDRLRADLDDEKTRTEGRLAAERQELAAMAEDLRRQAEGLAEREAGLARQVTRLKEIGAAVAAERKTLFDAKQAWEAERAAAAERDLAARQESESLRERVAAHFAELRSQAPDLEAGAQAALDRLAAARDVLRGHLAELHEYATQTREELDAARAGLRQQADDLDRARSEHRLAVTGFRQQLLEWQARVAELKQTMAQAEARQEQRQAELDEAAQRAAAAAAELERQATELRRERREAAEKRAEMERHLADMREWYRRKLRELAAGRPVDDSDMPGPPATATGGGRQPPVEAATESAVQPGTDAPRSPEPEPDADPADQHLGELLRSRGLVDDATLTALRGEARRQRRTLRQVLLASGGVTLYQLALIEAGNLDGLALGRLRVVDRVRSGAKETVYRVFDPARPGGPTRGVYRLRHLAEVDAQDAVRPDEFRQRFAAAAAAAHPNLANTLEVLEINGRPAVLQEWVAGLSSADWPPAAATPGVWLRLLTDAARGLNHAHRSGLVHGRLTPESFVLSADGTLKILGFGDPPWLAAGPQPVLDPLPSADLRALGRAAFGWSQLGSRRRGTRGKPFPNELTAVIRRLETGAESPMGDVVAIDRPYADAAELLRELARLADDNPCPADAWEKLVRFAAENAPGEAVPLRATA